MSAPSTGGHTDGSSVVERAAAKRTQASTTTTTANAAKTSTPTSSATETVTTTETDSTSKAAAAVIGGGEGGDTTTAVMKSSPVVDEVDAADAKQPAASSKASDGDDPPGASSSREAGTKNARDSATGEAGEDEAVVGDTGNGGDGEGPAAGPGADSSGSERGWRVKLYQLNEEGQWDDRGTGHISCRFVESLGGTALVVLAEEDGRELMQSKVVNEDVYQRQGDNIITWCEAPPLIGAANGTGAGAAGGGVDLALSFQENMGCLEIWEQICDVQGRFGNDYGRGRGGGEATVPLPDPKMDTLGEILELLKGGGPQAKDSYAASLSEKSGDYVGRLLKVFSDCEDLEDSDSLKTLCAIFKAIVGLNDGTLLEILLADNLFVDMAGVFEYDLELKEKGEHRQFLTETASFKQVLPIPDEEVVQRIHQNFRITFLKDALLRPMMDDAVVSTLNSLTFFNNTEIVQSLQHSDYVKDVFLLLNDPATSSKGGEKRRDILMFLRELFNMAKTLQVAPRDAFYRYLWDEVPLFEVFVPVLSDVKATVPERMACMGILLASLTHDPALFRTHIIKQGGHPPHPPTVTNQVKGSAAPKPRGALIGGGGGKSGGAGTTQGTVATVADCHALFFWVIRRLTTDQDTGVLLQAAEICRMALDTETMEGQPADRDKFLGIFYDHYIHWLVEPFWLSDLAEGERGSTTEALPRAGGVGAGSAGGQGDGVLVGARTTTDSSIGSTTRASMLHVSRGHICDLLSFCVRSHTFRMKYFVLRNNVVSRVLRLLACQDKYLKLSAIRFLRSCVGIKDEFYNRYLVKNNLLAPVFTLFRENGGRDNLINSAVIELVEFIRTENVKSLVEHVVERFSSSFVEVSQQAALDGIKLKHEQNVDLRENRDRDFGDSGGGGGGGFGSGAGDGVGGRGNRAAQNRRRMAEEDGDEAYFNEDDDDDDEVGPKLADTATIGPHQANGSAASGGLKLVAYGDEDESDEEPATAEDEEGREQQEGAADDGNGHADMDASTEADDAGSVKAESSARSPVKAKTKTTASSLKTEGSEQPAAANGRVDRGTDGQRAQGMAATEEDCESSRGGGGTQTQEDGSQERSKEHSAGSAGDAGGSSSSSSGSMVDEGDDDEDDARDVRRTDEGAPSNGNEVGEGGPAGLGTSPPPTGGEPDAKRLRLSM